MNYNFLKKETVAVIIEFLELSSSLKYFKIIAQIQLDIFYFKNHFLYVQTYFFFTL